jgi:ribosomal protein S18 acetylase RimI-like enzyme
MEVTDSLSFDHKDRKDIYEFIESRGTVREDEVRRALNLDHTALGTHLTILRRDGYLRKVGEKLQVAYQADVEEHHETEEFSYVVRTAREDDLEGLLEAVRTVAEEGTYIEAETVADALDHEEVVLRHNQLRSRMVFVACPADDEEVMGWVHLDLPEAEKLSHTAVLTVGIRPEYRGRGVGATLLERGVRWARDHAYEKLYNSVPATNESAVAFLETHGWEVEAVREDHYRIGGEYTDEVMMAYDVASGAAGDGSE